METKKVSINRGCPYSIYINVEIYCNVISSPQRSQVENRVQDWEHNERKDFEMSNSKIVSDILQYTGTERTSDWYVGIATDVKKRLFVEHNVLEKGSAGWIYRKADSERECRDTECYLLEHYRFKGDTGGGDKPLYVYAYKITANTVE